MEAWKTIKNYPYHEISDRGRVRVKARRVKTPMKHFRLVPAKLLKPSMNGDKVRYSLSINNTRKMVRLDSLMEEYWS